MNRALLLDHIDRLHTTEMGADRLKRNLKPDTEDVVAYCRELLRNPVCSISRKGKNWYCETNGIRLTIHAHSYTIITGHILK